MQLAIEQIRTSLSKEINVNRKKQLGQFFTPSRIASFMAGLFDIGSRERIRLLDAGAGIGSLSSAFLERCIKESCKIKEIELHAIEIEKEFHRFLRRNLEYYKNNFDLKIRIIEDDFIDVAVNWLAGDLFSESKFLRYSHAILNPPYKKIRSNSRHRLKLRHVGIETVNLYTAFVALALSLLEKHGELVAIIPRSFCNGPYYRPFRKYILNLAAIKRIHLFHSRNTAFKDDDVLQENVIIKLERGGLHNKIIISTSTDDQFDDLNIFEVPVENIIFPNDPELLIHIPVSEQEVFSKDRTNLNKSLNHLKVTVSTGPVIDFRVKEHLCKMPEHGTAPLLYPVHFKNGKVEWPNPDIKKSNAIRINTLTKKWLYPNGYYCVVRRFSSKEEKRRIVASVVEPQNFQNVSLLGFENHLNVFHDNKKGLSRELAYGLAAYLNTDFVDKIFRVFSGHTQVNATDLKLLPYPDKEVLIKLGKLAIATGTTVSDELENYLVELVR